MINNFALANKLGVKCYVVINAKNNEDTGVLLNTDFISFLNELNATIEVDVYNSTT